MARDNNVVILVLGIVGIVAIAGLFILALRSGAPTGGGTVFVTDGAGSPLYTVTDRPISTLRRVPFEPDSP